MSNTLLTPSVIAKEAIMVLENNLVMANLVHRDFDSEFRKVGATVTVRKPATFTATAFSTTVAAQNITESSVQVVLDKHYDITAEITSQQLSLDIVDFSMQVLQPMMREHAQKVDYQIFNTVYQGIAGHYPVTSTPVLGDLANLMAQLDLQKAPPSERRVVLHPITYAKYAALDAIVHADKRGKPLTINEYSIGRVLGADYYMDQNVLTHTSGIADTAGAFVGAATAGATAATVDALTDAEVVAAGDVFKVAGSDKGYLIVTGGTVGATTSAQVGITFTPALDVAIDDNAVVTFQDSHKVNIAFHKNAFALISAPLAPPMGGAAYGVANYKGISCRVVMDYTMSTKVNEISVDLLYGVKLLDKELAARLCD
jgi:uncharacterized protein YaiE (UPF0345 family)